MQYQQLILWRYATEDISNKHDLIMFVYQAWVKQYGLDGVDIDYEVEFGGTIEVFYGNLILDNLGLQCHGCWRWQGGAVANRLYYCIASAATERKLHSNARP